MKERRRETEYLAFWTTFRNALKIISAFVDDDKEVKASGLITTFVKKYGIKTLRDLKEYLLCQDLQDILDMYTMERLVEENTKLLMFFKMGLPIVGYL